MPPIQTNNETYSSIFDRLESMRAGGSVSPGGTPRPTASTAGSAAAGLFDGGGIGSSVLEWTGRMNAGVESALEAAIRSGRGLLSDVTAMRFAERTELLNQIDALGVAKSISGTLGTTLDVIELVTADDLLATGIKVTGENGTAYVGGAVGAVLCGPPCAFIGAVGGHWGGGALFGTVGERVSDWVYGDAAEPGADWLSDAVTDLGEIRASYEQTGELLADSIASSEAHGRELDAILDRLNALPPVAPNPAPPDPGYTWSTFDEAGGGGAGFERF